MLYYDNYSHHNDFVCFLLLIENIIILCILYFEYFLYLTVIVIIIICILYFGFFLELYSVFCILHFVFYIRHFAFCTSHLVFCSLHSSLTWECRCQRQESRFLSSPRPTHSLPAHHHCHCHRHHCWHCWHVWHCWGNGKQYKTQRWQSQKARWLSNVGLRDAGPSKNFTFITISTISSSVGFWPKMRST